MHLFVSDGSTADMEEGLFGLERVSWLQSPNRFDVHAQPVEDEDRKMWVSSQNIAGAGWNGTAQMTLYDTMGQMKHRVRQP